MPKRPRLECPLLFQFEERECIQGLCAWWTGDMCSVKCIAMHLQGELHAEDQKHKT